MSRFFHILFAACVLAVSCSEEQSGLSDAPEHGTQRKALLTVTFELPHEKVSRAENTELPEPSKPQPGTLAENRVSSALVVLGEIAKGANSPLTVHSVHRLTDLQMAGNESQWKGQITVAPDSCRVFVFANPLPESENLISVRRGDDWAKFVKQTVSFSAKDNEKVKLLWRDNNFMMTNAFRNTIDEHDVELVAGKENFATIYVQRVCARFEYHTQYENNTYTSQVFINGKQAHSEPLDIRLTDVGLMNVSRFFIC